MAQELNCQKVHGIGYVFHNILDRRGGTFMLCPDPASGPHCKPKEKWYIRYIMSGVDAKRDLGGGRIADAIGGPEAYILQAVPNCEGCWDDRQFDVIRAKAGKH